MVGINGAGRNGAAVAMALAPVTSLSAVRSRGGAEVDTDHERLERELADVRARLDAALARRDEAERGLAAARAESLAMLEVLDRAHAEQLAALRREADDEARRILDAARAEVVATRAEQRTGGADHDA